MKRYLKLGLASLFLLLLLFGSITVYTIVLSHSNGRLINYVGIVRGATQRLIKLELGNQPNDELIFYLDGILTELTFGEGPYGLPSPKDEEYQKNLAELNQLWGTMKTEILDYRSGKGNDGELLSLSEIYFDKANDTVFAADNYSERQTGRLLTVCIVTLGIMLLTWIIIFWAYSQKTIRLENKNKKLSDLARRDALTGVYLLDAFKEKAQRLLDSRPGEKFAIVYTDFADFKYINDVFGYEYGDSILTKYGEILRSSLEEHELCGRVSADNFVLLRRYRQKEEIAVRQRNADGEIISFMHKYHGGQSIPTCCGICCVEDVIEDLKIDGFLDRANFARKTVKNGSKINYAYYDESIRNRLREEKNVESRMQEALNNREFTIFYQPKVNLKTGTIACSEALVRWRLPSGEIIPPDKFIPVFERKFMINQLDQYVFEDVCRWLRHLLDEGKQALPVSVNVSRLQFYDPNFVGRYVEIRDRYRIPPGLLEIEFTESIAFDNTNLLFQIVSELKREGFFLSIDDFGKGYSSLSLLKSLPVDALKIDRFFFADSPDPERDLAVVQGIVDLVKKFHIQTIAEGVESEEQVELLKRIGCDFVQGYVFYRPMPQRDFEKLIAEKREIPSAAAVACPC